MTVLSRPDSIISEPNGELKDEHWTCLPASLVKAYEQRLEEIIEDFDAIDFEVLKAFVLSAHDQAGVKAASMDDSIGTIGAATDLKRLDDFTALVTATILQALPYLPRLTRLLETWTTRLSIARAAPKYLRDLKHARADLHHGWAALAISSKSQSRTAQLTGESLEEMKSVVSAQIHSLGKRLDGFLDMLEGRPEVVPDAWIDDFEEFEQNYGEWVVKAERKVLNGEWARTKVKPRDGQNIENGVDAQPVPKDVTIRTPLQSTVSTVIRGPTPPPRITSSPTRNENGSPGRTRHVPIVVSYDNPSEPFDIARGAASMDVLRASTGTPNYTPIARSMSRSPADSSTAAPESVKQRAAFLNGDIEKSESLMRIKSAPIVRPFEHASNAFTKLFKRDVSAEPGDPKDKPSKNIDETRTQATASKDASQNSRRGSKASTSGSGKKTRLGSVEMSRASSESRKSQKPRGRDTDRSERSKMVYGDLPMAIPLKPQASRGARKSEDLLGEETRSSASTKRRSESAGPANSGKRSLDARNRARSSMGVRGGTKELVGFSDVPQSGFSVLLRRMADDQHTLGKDYTTPATYIPSRSPDLDQNPSAESAEAEFPPNWPLSASVTPNESLNAEPEYFGATPASDGDRVPGKALRSSQIEAMFVRSIPDLPWLKQPAEPSNNSKQDAEQARALARPRSAPGSRSREVVPSTKPDKRASFANVKSPGTPDHSTRPSPVSVVKEKANPNERFSFSAMDADNDIRPRSQSTPPSKRNSMAIMTNSDSPGVKDTAAWNAFGINGGSSNPLISEGGKSIKSGAHDALSHDSVSAFPIPPATVPPRRSSLRSSFSSERSDTNQHTSASPPLPELRAAATPPLNSKILKPRHTKTRSRGSIGESTSSTEKKKKAPLGPGEDNFDRHVSEVLNRVHAPIRFNTRPGSATLIPQKISTEHKMKVRAERQSKNMTLSPADTSPHKASATDPEVKLYHLTQVGRSEPIKLYVRLVGEGERVMVRVGGGWADLADYLRQYAEHHGSRTVSDGMQLELQTASSPTSAPGSASSKRVVSSSALVPEPKSRVQITPTGGRVIAGSSENNDPWGPSRNGSSRPRLWLGDDSGDEQPASPDLPTSTGKSASRPSTAERPGSRHAMLDSSSPSSHGLSGKVRADLPEQKAKWVEGMIEKAMKSASAGGATADRDAQKAFGDMGKIAGTRRVVFKASEGAK